MKIILTSKPTFEHFSVEAGADDCVADTSSCVSVSGRVIGRHVDHHGKFAGFRAPCRRDIVPVGEDVTIEVTHMDTDCFRGIMILTGKANRYSLDQFGVFSDVMEQVDLNGSSVVDKFDTTLLYMVGIGQWLRANKLPRVTEERQDITDLIIRLMAVPVPELIEMGRVAQEKAWADYIACKKAFDRDAGTVFITCDASHAIDPSIAYGDKFEGFFGYQRVVVYRAHYKTVSIYCSPTSSFSYSGQTIAGIDFAGHPKACGSPRGVEITESQAQAVWSELVK